MKTWKKVDPKAIENAANPSISHVEFANGMDEIVLDCKTYSSQKPIVSASIPGLHSTGWRVFTEVTKEEVKAVEAARQTLEAANQFAQVQVSSSTMSSQTTNAQPATQSNEITAYESFLELRKILFQCDGNHTEPLNYWLYYFDCDDTRLLSPDMNHMMSQGKSISNSDPKVRFKGTDIGFAGQTIDFIVAELFFLHPTPQYKGRYLEIGGYFGLEFSNSLFFEQYLGWDGWLFEPTTCYDEMIKNRPKATSFKQGLCKDPVEDMAFGGFGNKCLPSNAPCLPLTSMDGWEDGFDFVSIDVEGAEMEILKAIDLTKVRIKVLLIEWRPVNANEREEYLKQFGYEKVVRFQWQGWGNADELFYRPDLIDFYSFDANGSDKATLR
jgi:hypothetical protein